MRNLFQVMLILSVIQMTYATEQFDDWYNRNHFRMKLYDVTKEESMLAYAENSAYVNKFNSEPHSYKLSMDGPWAGMPKQKFLSLFPKRRNITSNIRARIENKRFLSYQYLPDSIDYRSQMSPVRDQSSCGGCYSFGSVGAIEGRLNIIKNYKFDLSEQQIIDCTISYGNNGCNGGIVYNVYDYLMDGNYLSYEYDYPFKASTGTCNKNVKAHVALYSYKSVRGKMQEALLRGPLDMALYVVSSFQLYGSGYYDEHDCKTDPDDMNHEMVAVGYGYNNNRLYYIIRNSWSSSWGMDGYAYIYEGVCGVDCDPVEPSELGLY